MLHTRAFLDKFDIILCYVCMFKYFLILLIRVLNFFSHVVSLKSCKILLFKKNYILTVETLQI